MAAEFFAGDHLALVVIVCGSRLAEASPTVSAERSRSDGNAVSELAPCRWNIKSVPLCTLAPLDSGGTPRRLSLYRGKNEKFTPETRGRIGLRPDAMPIATNEVPENF